MAVAVLAPSVAQAGDGVYGRFEGDVELSAAAGTELIHPTRLAVRLSTHYFQTAGVFVAYRDALGSQTTRASGGEGPTASYGRGVTVGIDLRPLFIPRWSQNLQVGRSTLDLTIDSLSVSLGAYLQDGPDVPATSPGSDGKLGDHRGFELGVGGGIPLAATAAGPWLEARVVLRWDDPGPGTSATAATALQLLISWRALVDVGVSDRLWDDR